jgi:hypothetical protein
MHGILQVSGVSRESALATDAYDVIVDERAELTVVLLDVETEPTARAGLRFEALAAVRDAVRERAPIYEVVTALRAFVTCEAKSSAGIALLRFSQPDARVEILNAGMPPIGCVLPDGRLTLHAPLSPSVGRRIGDVHPYELSPLVWGSSWIVMSDGVTGGSHGHDAVRAVLERPGFTQQRAELGSLEPAALAELAFAEHTPAGGGDASLLVVHSDPSRFHSGILGLP